MKGQIAGAGPIIGIAVSAIMIFQVALPIVKTAIAGSDANLTATELIIANLATLFIVLGFAFGAGRTFGIV